MHSLERYRLRADLTEVFKWYRSYNKGDISKVRRVNNQDIARKNVFKLEKFRFRREIGRNWFSNKVVYEWNRLSNRIVSGQTLGSFKRRLNKFMDEDDRRKQAEVLTYKPPRIGLINELLQLVSFSYVLMFV